MSNYTINVLDNINCHSEINTAINILDSGDKLAIYTDNVVTKESIVKDLINQKIDFKYVTDGKKEYILALKE